MSNNAYHFVTHWTVQSTVEEVYDVISDGPDLVRWWPSVYLDVQELEHGQENGVGRVVSLYTKGWLPYTLRWQFRITENNKPYGFALEAWGDFDGRGIWTLAQDSDHVNITYDWKIEANKAILRKLSLIMKPIFSANHYWAMGQGEKSLKLELERRKAISAQDAIAVPAPPGPTFNWLISGGSP